MPELPLFKELPESQRSIEGILRWGFLGGEEGFESSINWLSTRCLLNDSCPTVDTQRSLCLLSEVRRWRTTLELSAEHEPIKELPEFHRSKAGIANAWSPPEELSLVCRGCFGGTQMQTESGKAGTNVVSPHREDCSFAVSEYMVLSCSDFLSFTEFPWQNLLNYVVMKNFMKGWVKDVAGIWMWKLIDAMYSHQLSKYTVWSPGALSFENDRNVSIYQTSHHGRQNLLMNSNELLAAATTICNIYSLPVHAVDSYYKYR